MLRISRVCIVFVFAALMLSACQLIQPEPAAQEVQPAQVDTELKQAFAGEFSGSTVDMYGVFPNEMYTPTLAGFVEKTGIEVNYFAVDCSTPEFAQMVEAGKGPDMCVVTYPSPIVSLARKGLVVDLHTFLSPEMLQERYEPQWLRWGEMSTPDGTIFGALITHFFPASVVWYPKAAFEEAGYAVPNTWEELLQLSDQIVADEGTPWCIQNGFWGDISAGAPAAQWVQDIMLRTVSEEEYEQWFRGELKFDSPQVRRAMQLMADIWFKPGYVYPDRERLNTTYLGELNAALQSSPPKCWMMREPSWISALTQFEGEFGQEYAFFNLPAIDPAYGQPIQVEGHFLFMLKDRPEVRALIEYFTTGAQLDAWIKQYETQGFDVSFSPHKGAGLAPHTTLRDQITFDMIQNADRMGFTAIDIMPVETNIQFARSMVDYVAGQIDLDTALQQIDDSWPAP